MVWDKTIPLGTEDASQGDDRIREMKSDVEDALQAQDPAGGESVFPGSDTSAPVYRYRGLKDSTAARPAAGDYGFFFDETRNVIQRDNGTTWDDVATLIPAGTIMVFYQAAAPVGWTKQTVQDDKALRVVSAAGGGSGGALPISATLNHRHTVAPHDHTLQGDSGAPSSLTTGLQGGGSGTAASATHTHGVGSVTGSSAPITDLQLGILAYIDVIICSKD